MGAAIVGGAALGLTGAVAWVGNSRAGGSRSDSARSVDERTSVLGFKNAPVAKYTVDYRIEDPGRAEASRELVAVDRPWRSLRRGPTFVQLSDFGALGNRPERAEEVGFVTPPALAAGDSRPEIALPAAVEAGLAVVGERRRVLGQDCQVYSTGFPLDAGPITRPTADRTESCVDRRGIVLEEVLVVDDHPVRKRVAASVEVGAGLSPGDVEIADPRQSLADGGASVREIGEMEATKLAKWALVAPPGFVRRGYYAVVYPAADLAEDPRGLFSRLAVVSTVWSRGADVVIFESGATLDGSPVAKVPAVGSLTWPTRRGAESPGRAELTLSARGNEMRSARGGEWVRLLATVVPDELVEFAGSVTRSGAAA